MLVSLPTWWRFSGGHTTWPSLVKGAIAGLVVEFWTKNVIKSIVNKHNFIQPKNGNVTIMEMYEDFFIFYFF